ncbi:MAG: cupin [Epsilonproteobacteria bacterium]|nr:cupin [Campylobacterota bacterium]
MNIYTLQNPKPDFESFTTLYQNKNIKIEAIRSHLLQPGETYNQEQDEWVVLIRGNAQMKVADKIIQFSEGDSLFLSRHTVHQVLSTSQDALWLGVFIDT